MSDGSADVASRQRQLQAILELSQDLVARARAGEWEQVAELERARRERLLHCFERAVSVVEAPLVAGALRGIAEYDRCLNNLVVAARAKIAAELRRMHAGQQALQAYSK